MAWYKADKILLSHTVQKRNKMVTLYNKVHKLTLVNVLTNMN